MTTKDFKFLWFRDKAYSMDKPSIDRKRSNKNYEINNCQFLELDDNIRKSNDPKRNRDKLGRYI